MTWPDVVALLPLVITGYAAVALLVIGAYWRNHAGIGALALAGLAAAFVAVFAAAPLAPRQVTPLLRVDSMALLFIGLFTAGGFAVAIFAHDYFRETPAGSEKFYALLLLAVAGMGVLAASSHFASFFLGLETLSISLYGLIGYTLGRKASLEASLKYLVLAAASLSFLLLGMALVYFESGTMEFGALARGIAGGPTDPTPVLLVGLGLMLVGFSFKLAVVPFHTWAPDVYQGAPAPISALIATGSKAAVFVLMLRFLWALGLGGTGGQPHSASSGQASTPTSLFALLQVLAIMTMFGGNLLALLQRNLKRLLAYSSIAHMGYLLIPLLAGGAYGASSFAFYFISYFITTIGAFGVVSVLSRPEAELEELEDYRGLGFRRPWLGGALALMMLSLAGAPPTIGFMAKFYIFAAAAHSSLWLLLVLGVINAGLAAYYYLRVLAVIYARPAVVANSGPPAGAQRCRDGQLSARTALIVLSALVLVFGIYPAPLMSLAQRAWELWQGAP